MSATTRRAFLRAVGGGAAHAAIAAVNLLEPKTQRVHLTSGTLKTGAEVKAWLTGEEKDLLAKLKDA